MRKQGGLQDAIPPPPQQGITEDLPFASFLGQVPKMEEPHSPGLCLPLASGLPSRPQILPRRSTSVVLLASTASKGQSITFRNFLLMPMCHLRGNTH